MSKQSRRTTPPGSANPSSLAATFTPSINILSFDDNVTAVDTDAKLEPVVSGELLIALGHGLLDFDGAPDCVNHAGKLDQCAIADELDHPAIVGGNLRVDDVLSGASKPR